MVNIPQTTCTLDGYKFRFNFQKQTPYQPMSATYTPTLTGGFITTYGAVQQDATIEITAPVLPEDIFSNIYSKYILGINMNFIDWNGVSQTVFCLDFKPADGVVPAGVNAYYNVTLKMQVVSIP